MAQNRRHYDTSERSPLLLRDDQPTVNGPFDHSSTSDSTCSSPILAADIERVVSAAEDAGLPGPGLGGGGARPATGDAVEDQGQRASNRNMSGHTPKMKLLMPAISIGVYLCALDQLLAVATYAKIGSDLNALNSTSWVATA